MNALPVIAVVLVVLWVLAEVLGFVLGAALHLLWIGAVVVMIVWGFQKFRHST